MIGVNLIPSELLIRHAVRRRVRGWGIVCVLLAGAALVPVIVEGRQQANIERLRLQVADTEAKLSTIRVQVVAIAQAVLDTDAELARAEALRTKRSWSGLLAQVSHCAPNHTWLTSINTPIQAQSPKPKVQSPKSRVRSSASKVKTQDSEPETRDSPVVVLQAPTCLQLDGFALGHEGLYDLMSRLKGSGSFSTVKLVRAGVEPVLQGHAVRFVLMCEW